MKKIIKICFIFFLLFGFTGSAAAISNKAIHWGFNKARNGEQADAGQEYEAVLEKYGAFYKGNPNDKTLYLTFDNGYENGYTKQILDVLKKEKVPAAFFVTGHYVRSAPDLTKRMVNEGHIVGNHSWSHPDLTQMSVPKIKQELTKVKKETERITGQKGMQYLRPPRGILSERTLKVAQEAGYTHVLWSLAYKDWEVDHQKGWKYAHDQILAQVHPGAVLLLHTVSKDNAEALEKVIQDLKKQGYTFKSLDDFVMKEQIKNPALTM
ncbi:delta-lactam-biosynthetic de-N-acetylase [Bacillus sp. J14TS2]|uniref:delta-lactam-biosynthetic de-N-acetylase n=1 Tax=Bacillus sp. J14TS2 TaxID=2807188 RepID=UPI001B1E37EA|nr:delta-lactam-biosynthetic de-N-acetylase [Bacillus sp. J14TS2]GIN74591.1 delta-lactam-biosynthetic de-N-acetylase [Bacillus sp. J14TS2]